MCACTSAKAGTHPTTNFAGIWIPLSRETTESCDERARSPMGATHCGAFIPSARTQRGILVQKYRLRARITLLSTAPRTQRFFFLARRQIIAVFYTGLPLPPGPWNDRAKRGPAVIVR